MLVVCNRKGKLTVVHSCCANALCGLLTVAAECNGTPFALGPMYLMAGVLNIFPLFRDVALYSIGVSMLLLGFSGSAWKNLYMYFSY